MGKRSRKRFLTNQGISQRKMNMASKYVVIEALREIKGDRFPVQKGELRVIRFGYEKPDFVPRTVAQVRAGETIDWGGASVATDAYRLVFDGEGPLPQGISDRLPRPVTVSA